MTAPKGKISVVANTWIKQMHFVKAGDINDGHTHLFDHQTLLGKGSVKVTVNEKVSEFKAPTIIFIRAGLKHQIEALEDDTICYCIHAIRDGERVEDIIDPADIPEGGMNYIFTQEDADVLRKTPQQYLK
jgi:hypothetical protein